MVKKKFLILGFALVLVIGLVAAAWFFEYDNEVEGTIVASGKKMWIMVDLQNFVMNASNGSVENYQDLTIDNKKDPRNVTFLINVSKNLTEVGCPDYENDCNVELWNTTSEITNGTTYLIPKGILYYYLNTTCEAYSCGQNITVHVEIKE